MMESIGTEAAALEVLLVEDSRNDVLLTREALKKGQDTYQLARRVGWRRSYGFSGTRGGACQCCSPKSYLAPHEPTQEKWSEGFGGDQAESDTEGHSCRYLD